MKNLLKLASLAGFSFALIVFGACGGGSGGGGGGYTVTVNGTVHSGTFTAAAAYTVTNGGLTYYHTGTETTWQLCPPEICH